MPISVPPTAAGGCVRICDRLIKVANLSATQTAHHLPGDVINEHDFDK